MIKVAIGQDSHRFEPDSSDKRLIREFLLRAVLV